MADRKASSRAANHIASPAPSTPAPSSTPSDTPPTPGASLPAGDAAHTPSAATTAGEDRRVPTSRRVQTAPTGPLSAEKSTAKDERVGGQPKPAAPTEPKQEDRFKMLTNSAGFTRDQVVTREEIERSHPGVKVADWLKRKIVEPTQ